ncbi:lytic transglycosylase domain-containing protein [Limnohabitans sp. Bal53]|uniref:lytic transglycosylase domain-containing protein n=1 Tax=Limnohabitans sp. Bal53 TaxID=1977910 RepID=UPI001304F1E3|nr:lytic transglycosylase domain-containing protein [Limnohabitans sp. Bal53]
MTATWTRLKLVAHTLICDVREGFVEITRHSLALIGLIVVAIALTFVARPGLQQTANDTLIGWLQGRQVQLLQAQEAPWPPSPAERSTATSVNNLNQEQVAVTQWLSRKYKISPEPLAALVSEAWSLGERSQIAPTLILSIMAIESRFNPFASGSQGAMGLMQIEPDAHSTVLSPFGGRLAAFDPLTNLRVGTRYLQGLIHDTTSLEEALRLYALASGQGKGEQYVERVLAEQKLMDHISQGQKTALANKTNASQTPLPKTQM